MYHMPIFTHSEFLATGHYEFCGHVTLRKNQSCLYRFFDSAHASDHMCQVSCFLPEVHYFCANRPHCIYPEFINAYNTNFQSDFDMTFRAFPHDAS